MFNPEFLNDLQITTVQLFQQKCNELNKTIMKKEVEMETLQETIKKKDLTIASLTNEVQCLRLQIYENDEEKNSGETSCFPKKKKRKRRIIHRIFTNPEFEKVNYEY